MFNFFEGVWWAGSCTDSNSVTFGADNTKAHRTPHTMAVQALEGQAAAARAMAYEAAASLRSTAFVSRMGIDLGPDVLLGFRLVLVKLGSGPLTQLGQKTLSSLPIAYAACTIKEHKQMPSAERDKQMTTTLMEFAIPHFILLLKQAARELDLPPPCDFERKLYLTTLGTGTCTDQQYRYCSSCGRLHVCTYRDVVTVLAVNCEGPNLQEDSF